MERDTSLSPCAPTTHIDRPSLTRFTATFGFAWLMIGLFTGTIVLVVLVRWLVGILHQWGWGQTAENRVLIGLILAFVVASFILTRAIVRRIFRLTSSRGRRTVLGLLMVPGLLSLWAWSNPTRVLAGLAGTTVSRVGVTGGPTFIFGSYPDGARLEQLKKQGVRTVISLQHPAVLVELQGIKAEREQTDRLGLSFVQLPMLPWVSDNSEVLTKLRALADTAHGTYYVHCGLGRDRVNIAKRIVEASVDTSHARIAVAGIQAAMGFEDRLNAPFQYGRVFQLAPDVWLIPFPNADELHTKVLQGRTGHVFFLLDPQDSVTARWMREAEPKLRDYVVPFTVVRFTGTDSARTAEVMAEIRSEKPPVTIVVPATTWTDPSETVMSRAAAEVLRSYGVIPATARPRLLRSALPGQPAVEVRSLPRRTSAVTKRTRASLATRARKTRKPKADTASVTVSEGTGIRSRLWRSLTHCWASRCWLGSRRQASTESRE
jgi:hypothetical protein